MVTVRKYTFSADQLSDSSGVESYDDKISKPQKLSECAEEPILKAMVALRKNICEDCLNCKKCAPAEYIPVDEVEKIKYLPMNTCPEIATKVDLYFFLSFKSLENYSNFALFELKIFFDNCA